MRVIYTSKGMSKKFGVRVIYRKIRYLPQKQVKENANKTTETVTTIGQMTTPKKINKNTQVNVITYFLNFNNPHLTQRISSGKSVSNDSITENIFSSLCTSVLSWLALLLPLCSPTNNMLLWKQ
jgi:hypothetical protein